MFRPRVIPVLLLKDQGLVKSKGFKDYQYIGDPINAVKIFNDLKADEEKIKSLSNKPYTPYEFKYKEIHEFNDSQVTPQVQERINSWVEDISDIITLEYSSIQITELKKNFIKNKESLLIFTTQIFKFFLHNSNITIEESPLYSICEFILSEVENGIKKLEVEEI